MNKVVLRLGGNGWYMCDGLRGHRDNKFNLNTSI